jgi:hypothetical protein
MYSDQSFGGANRGPGSARPRSRRSNVFVDLGFVVLFVGCLAAVGCQYLPLLTTSGYNVASGHIDYVRECSPFSADDDYRYSYSSRRRSYLVSIHARYSYTPSGIGGGKQYTATAMSMPVFGIINFDTFTMKNDINSNGLNVRYDPNDPQKSVPVEIVDHFTKSALITYLLVFFVGLIMLTLAGMSNLSGEKWRPGMRTDAY